MHDIPLTETFKNLLLIRIVIFRGKKYWKSSGILISTKLYGIVQNMGWSAERQFQQQIYNLDYSNYANCGNSIILPAPPHFYLQHYRPDTRFFFSYFSDQKYPCCNGVVHEFKLNYVRRKRFNSIVTLHVN